MDFGLILFLTSILLGNPSDNNSNESSETQDSTSNNNKTTQKISSAEDTSNEDTQTYSRKLLNKAPTISGTADKVVMQDEYYDFTPLSVDLENDKLEYSIKNKPDWAVFDSRTGNVSGKPNNANIGITKDIIITVFDIYGASASLKPFSIEVINVNDQPIISGNPSLYVSPEKSFKFKPKVKDIDLDIGLDKLIFSIKNKPKWASFNINTGELRCGLNSNKFGQYSLTMLY
ncbi:MAG: putative Ig domain-containing protein [Porticoccaceae bacterium]